MTDNRACIWIEPTAEDGVDPVRTALIWPTGFEALDDPLRILGPDAQILARVGDVVELGGGGPAVDYVPTSQQDPCQIGRVFYRSVVATVNGTRVDTGAGSLQIVTRQLGSPGTCGAAFMDPVMLVMSGGHLQLRMDGTDWEVSWPHGFSAVPGERITILDGNGVVVLRQGVESSTVRGSLVQDQIEVCGFGDITYDLQERSRRASAADSRFSLDFCQQARAARRACADRRLRARFRISSSPSSGWSRRASVTKRSSAADRAAAVAALRSRALSRSVDRRQVVKDRLTPGLAGHLPWVQPVGSMHRPAGTSADRAGPQRPRHGSPRPGRIRVFLGDEAGGP